MAELSALVTDTHPLIFHAAGGKRLGRSASRAFRAAEQGKALIYVPMVVLWELGLLAKRGRVRLGRSLGAFTEDLFSNPSYQPVDLDLRQLRIADERRPNEDPFDALVCAAAFHLELPLITADAEIETSRLVTTVW